MSANTHSLADVSSFIDYDSLISVPSRTNEVDDIGHAVERWVCERLGYEHERAPHYDARGPGGRPVQVKAAAWRVQNGTQRDGSQRYATGRFRLYESDHDFLLEQDGEYVFVVYEWHRLGLIPLYLRRLPADAVDAFLLDAECWHETAGVPKRQGRDVRVAWTDVFPNGVGI